MKKKRRMQTKAQEVRKHVEEGDDHNDTLLHDLLALKCEEIK